ncbi:protein NDR1-like [Pistacia vera]|uniref:protein NDR1-like n=1 Tax=Pistacia vera TaxID=55513 RepID=UPI0012630A3B|nr:protein NDR1-like [Pistacia vera]
MPQGQEQRRGWCRCCCNLIFSLGLTSLFMWLNLRTSNPKCSIQDFYLPALNKSLNSPHNTTLYFTLKLVNTNTDKGVYYDPVNFTIVNKANATDYIGNYVVPKFYQGHKKKARKHGSVKVDKRVLSRVVFSDGTAIFRVDLATAVRFKIMAWKTKRHRIRVGADVMVNDHGTFNEKNIKLSQATMSVRFCREVGVLLNFLVFVLLNL